MNYPTIEEVERADRLQLARWFRFLASPTAEQLGVLNRIILRLGELGGWTPEISKAVGLRE